MNLHRALQAVVHALGPSTPALMTFVHFGVGFKSTPTTFLYMVILVLPARAGGFIRATAALVMTRVVSR